MENKIDVSVAIATYNEANNLNRCLASVASWVKEIVIVDGGSTDATLDIAKHFKARVIITDNPSIFHINKQKALDNCKSSWILQLDADEEVSPELAREIKETVAMNDNEIDARGGQQLVSLFKRHQELLEKRDGKIGTDKGAYSAFFIPRKNYFLGHPLRYSGTYPDGVIRLVRRGKAWFPAKSVHEQIQIDGRVGWLSRDLWHFSNPTISRYLKGADRYTSLMSEEIKRKASNPVFLFLNYMLYKPIYSFLNLFIRHKGFLDGFYGLLFDVLSSLHYQSAYLKYVGVVRNDS